MSGIDTIPKLVKLSTDFLTPLLTKVINTGITHIVFPENAKTASVIPLDKSKPNKNEMSNFRRMNVRNTFSKDYEKVIKDQLVCGMEKYFPPFLSAYRKNYNLQNNSMVILKGGEKIWIIIFIILLDRSVSTAPAFDCIPHDLLIAEL